MEQRSRTKWSIDPQNKAWSEDKSRFGYQMMTKMGWSDGKGLGAKQNGELSHVKVQKKNNTLGVGAKNSYDHVWISHQDDFSAILSTLNGINGDKPKELLTDQKTNSLEHAVKKSRKKIMYSKFIKSKDLSRASTDDMVGIFGSKSKSEPPSPLVQSEVEDEGNQTDGGAVSDLTSRVTSHGITTIDGGSSIHDYFAQKLKAIADRKMKNGVKDERSNNTTDFSIDISTEVITNKEEEQERGLTETENITKKRKKKKKQKKSDYDDGTNDTTAKSEPITIPEESTCQELNVLQSNYETDVNDKKKKKKKKRKSQDDNDSEYCAGNSHEKELEDKTVEETKRKKKKRKHCDSINSEQKNENDFYGKDRSAKKKKKKSKNM